MTPTITAENFKPGELEALNKTFKLSDEEMEYAIGTLEVSLEKATERVKTLESNNKALQLQNAMLQTVGLHQQTRGDRLKDWLIGAFILLGLSWVVIVLAVLKLRGVL